MDYLLVVSIITHINKYIFDFSSLSSFEDAAGETLLDTNLCRSYEMNLPYLSLVHPCTHTHTHTYIDMYLYILKTVYIDI